MTPLTSLLPPAPPPPQDNHKEPKRHRPYVARLRHLGQGLALPIAAMPTAGLLLRLGQDDLLGRHPGLREPAAVISGAGSAVLDNLPLLFALGIALGLSRSTDVAGRVLGCAIAYLIMSRAVLTLNPLPAGQPDIAPARWPYGALLGILGALLAMAIWKAMDRRRRPLPLLVVYAVIALAALFAGTILGLAYPTVDRALSSAAAAVADHAVAGGGAFGFLNRILLPLGLHHVPSAIVWYITGDCGNGVKGDVPCFFTEHDPDAGIFMTGFFPIAMFALPAAALAIWRSALPSQRPRVAAVMLPAAAMSALTGITEPIELAFAYTAPVLYLAHAVLTGVSLALVNALDIHAGFLFSAGTVDYVFNFPLATRPLLLLPIGMAYGALYYALFRFAITRFNLRTPGRDPDAEQPTPLPEEGTRHP
ncbi:PTS transporter subunit EIIC [Streptomyces yaizuensis]|uniref:PTS transporter subunit EIIC n=1 Tax=Streptomyces yaizuensis TaxID=2989713 RepID=A0ABQ5P6F9_9ACTN|nr:PTS transporter subunit EIIC [Streptomyces sp. YSPA8]GLF98063.1 PTS transporter subunit EIIC [Streptomyces sp. YSPA8]